MRAPLITSGLLALCVACTPEPTPIQAIPDRDNDGFDQHSDCNDVDPETHPGAPELCDGVDQNCNDIIDDNAQDALTWYLDSDSDGAGNPAVTTLSCTQPTGFVPQATDCDDADPHFHPGAAETSCTDPNDYNCDGSVGFVDADGDGFAACQDCDDNAAGVNFDAVEICDGVDNDCDTVADETGAIGEDVFFGDLDGDGFGNSQDRVTACEPPAGYVRNAQDCNDTSATTNPGGFEICDGLDNDCDGYVDRDATDAPLWFVDADGDGHGTTLVSARACVAPLGFVDTSDDCNDASMMAYPGATESCDGADNDCDGAIDENLDADGDGYSGCGEDCNDAVASVHPGARESCDNIDNDCDGAIDEAGSNGETRWYIDLDGDGYGASVTAYNLTSCSAPSGYVHDNTDCDDTRASINPSAPLACDGRDNNCDGLVDSDNDGDGFADANCGGSDCDDNDPAVVPGVDGTCSQGTSCQDVLQAGFTQTGLYFIDPDGANVGRPPMQVWCDQDIDGGGWTRAVTKVAGDSGHCNAVGALWTDLRHITSGWSAGGEILAKVYHGEQLAHEGAAPLSAFKFQPGPYSTIHNMFAFPNQSSNWAVQANPDMQVTTVLGPLNFNRVDWDVYDDANKTNFYASGTTGLGLAVATGTNISYCSSLWTYDGIVPGDWHYSGWALEMYVREP